MLLEGVAAFWAGQNKPLFSVWLKNIQPKHHPSSIGLDTHSESLQNKPGPVVCRHLTGVMVSVSLPHFPLCFLHRSLVKFPFNRRLIYSHIYPLSVSNKSETNRRFRFTLMDLQVGGFDIWKNVSNHSGRVFPHGCRVQLCSWSALCLFGAFMFHPGGMDTQPGANGLKATLPVKAEELTGVQRLHGRKIALLKWAELP